MITTYEVRCDTCDVNFTSPDDTALVHDVCGQTGRVVGSWDS